MDLQNLVGQTVGDYHLKRLLGKGGMGAVFLAWHRHMNLPFAVKVLRPDFALNAQYLRRFFHEAHLGARLRHDNIVSIYNAGQAEIPAAPGVAMLVPYLAMEHIVGQSLRSAVKEAGGKLGVDIAVEIISQALRGLAFAHSRGMVHRDIKPDNLMISSLGIVKITDFGLARHIGVGTADITITGQVLGTPTYMSLEQWRAEPTIDGRTDIYSLGVTFFYLLAGATPFRGKNPAAVLHQLLHDAPPRLVDRMPEIDPELDAIVQKMVARNRKHRFQAAEEALLALYEWRRYRPADTDTIERTVAMLGATAALDAATLKAGSEPLTEPTARPFRTPMNSGHTTQISVGNHAIAEMASRRGKRRSSASASTLAAPIPPPPPTESADRAPWLRGVRKRIVLGASVVVLAIYTLIGLVVYFQPPTRSPGDAAPPPLRRGVELRDGRELPPAAPSAIVPPATDVPSAPQAAETGPSSRAPRESADSVILRPDPQVLAMADSFFTAETIGTAEAYRQFLTDHPSSPYREKVEERLAALDSAAFSAASHVDTLAAYQDYLAEFPGGAHTAEALDHIAWKRAVQAVYANAHKWDRMLAALRDYRDAFPTGRHLSEFNTLATTADTAYVDGLLATEAGLLATTATDGPLDSRTHAALVAMKEYVVDAAGRRPNVARVRARLEPYLRERAQSALERAELQTEIRVAWEEYRRCIPNGPFAVEAGLRAEYPLPSRERPDALPAMRDVHRNRYGFWTGRLEKAGVNLEMIYVPRGFVAVTPHTVPPGARVFAEYDGFWLSATEVSADDYRRYLAIAGHNRSNHPASDWPVTGVTAEQAREFCRWFYGGDLPTETQFLAAARGFADVVPRPFPWGHRMPDAADARESLALSVPSPRPVNDDTVDVGPYGHRFLAGNVREWCRDGFFPDGLPALSGPDRRLRNPFFSPGNRHAVRGGSFATPTAAATLDFRSGEIGRTGQPDIGFRVCIDPHPK